MKDYYSLMETILQQGHDHADRTGKGRRSLFGKQMNFDLKRGFPLCTGKFTSFKSVAAEALWFLSGSTNVNDLRKLNGNDKPTIWDEWADASGDLGPIYGEQFRRYDHYYGFARIDQIAMLIDGLKRRPFSSRHIVTAWNPVDLPNEDKTPQENVSFGKMALAPCHCLCQFFVREDDGQKYLSCRLDQRSADFFLGVPYNIASYALLTHMVAHVTGMIPDELIWHGGDCHLYLNHLEQAEELLNRDVTKYPLPRLYINRTVADIDDFKLSDFEIVGYQSYPAIKAEVAV